MDNILARLETYILYAVVFLLPITVLSISPNPFVPAKLTVLSVGVALVLLIKALRVISSGKLEFSVGSFDFPVALLAVAYLLSAILRTPNKMEAFLLPGTATAVISASLLYFLINQLSDKEKKVTVKILLLSAVVFTVILLASFAGIFASIPQLPEFMRATSFNPAAGYLPAAVFLVSVLPMGVGLLLSEKIALRKAFMGVASAVVLLGLVVSVFNMLPGKPTSPRFPNASTSWAVAIDTLKESPIFGVGPSNYVTAFSRFRPLAYNTTELWAVKFATANDFYLTLLTETGLLGAAGIILLILSVYRLVRVKLRLKLQRTGAEAAYSNPSTPAGGPTLKAFSENANTISVSLLIILLALFPATVLLIAVFFILLSLTSIARKTTLNLSTQVAETPGAPSQASQRLASRLPAILVTLPVIVAVVLFGFRASRVLAAEIRFTRALNALAQNRATVTYDTMREAINLNPQVDRYHASYAQINLALANSIAGQAAGPEGEITDQDRVNIAQLIQQSIREGKATVALNPLRAANWELLARIYQAIIPFAQGADVFAAQTMAQAVALDPINPNLRIALGGIHFGAGNFDTAVRVFELATVAKADHANARYNLAFALREDGKIDRAINEMTIVLSLTDPGTQDYETARTALEDLEARRAASTEAPAGEELTPPQPAEEPVIEPPLELPEESEPPEAPITPTPTEGPTPTVSPSPTLTPEPTPTPAP